MSGPRRWQAAVGAAALLLAGLAGGAAAYAPAFTCPGAVNVGSWQRLPIPTFQPIANIASTDKVTSYGVATTRPELVVVTNGKRLQVSTVHGCAWSNGLALGVQPTTAVPLSGASSTIIATAILPSGRVLAAVREGSGPASRPHIVASEDGRAGYRTYDTGLPAQAAPKLLVAASDGRTVYLVLTPGAPDSPVGGLPLPGVPDPTTPTGASKAGLLYASTDGGHSWLLATGAQDLPAGGGGLDLLAVDHQNPQDLYAVSHGLLLISNNGGRSFERTRLADGDVTAVESMGPAVVAVFTARGVVAVSRDSGHTFTRARTLSAVTSAAYRAGDGRLAVEADGYLALLNPSTGATEPVPGVGTDPGTLLGDVSTQASFHAVSAHDLLRYTDPKQPTVQEVIGADSDFGVPLPTPGTITPAFRAVRLRVGTSASYDYTLALKVSRTPLDLMLLVDTAPSMTPYLDELKAGLATLVETVKGAGIDLQVGVATFGTGPRQGPLAVAPPYVNPDSPTDLGSSLYRRYRQVSPVDGKLAGILNSVQSARENGDRAQLIGLEQATLGSGVKPPLVPEAVPVYLIPPNRGAAWRPDPGIRRLMVLATDQPFGNPGGSPNRPDGSLNFAQVVREMYDWERVHLLGQTFGAAAARADLATIAAGTRSVAPRGGADCGGGSVLAAGSPLVCDTKADVGGVTGRLITGLSDLQTVTLAPAGAAPHVVSASESRALRGIDVTIPNLVPFSLRVSCPRRSPGRKAEEVVATMRGLPVATTQLVVDCVGPGAALPLRPPPAPAPVVAPVAPPPVAQAPAPVVPAAPVVQPVTQVQAQPQPQVQAQINPLTAAALQRQEQAELARALADGSDDTTLAMVGRRREDEAAALTLLAAAMTACAALGLVRLRTRREPECASAAGRGG